MKVPRPVPLHAPVCTVLRGVIHSGTFKRPPSPLPATPSTHLQRPRQPPFLLPAHTEPFHQEPGLHSHPWLGWGRLALPQKRLRRPRKVQASVPDGSLPPRPIGTGTGEIAQGQERALLWAELEVQEWRGIVLGAGTIREWW